LPLVLRQKPQEYFVYFKDFVSKSRGKRAAVLAKRSFGRHLQKKTGTTEVVPVGFSR